MHSTAQAPSASWAFKRYEAVRHRLPGATFPAHPEAASDLGELKGEFDAFVLDSFGVLNVGETPIAGARERIEALRAEAKQVAVLTNGATVPLVGLEQKYAGLGFAFTRNEIVSSRELLANALRHVEPGLRWGVAAPLASKIRELPATCHALLDRDGAFEDCDGFILLSSQDWNDRLQIRLIDALSRRPRPLLVGNPDLVAPREDAFTREPGAHAHDIADRLGVAPAFYGKPFANAFDEAQSRLGEAIDPQRIAIVGDTLHTDILGGAAAGWRTILVTDHGVMKDLDVPAAIELSGIVPDFIVPGV